MSSGFSKFVEWATDSRYVPLGSCCSLCSRKLGFFRTGFWSMNAAKLSDGVLCEKCAEKAEHLIDTKCDWPKREALWKSSWNQYNVRNWHIMSVQTASEMIAAKEQEAQEYLAFFGNEKSSLFRIRETVQIEPTAWQVGVVRSKRLRSKVVVFGTVECGDFSKNDAVQLAYGNALISTTILEAYARDCEANTLEVNLRANMGRNRLQEGEAGWLILDHEGYVDEDAVLVR